MKSLFTFKFFLLLVLGCIHTSYSQSVLYVTSLADNGTGTLRQQITNAFPGDTIKFQVTGTIYLANILSVSKEIVIIGPGVSNLTISHAGGYNFHANSMLSFSDNIYISDLKILGSSPSNTYAPGISAGGTGKTVKILRVHFENCRRIPISGITTGGALSAIGDSITIDDCQFINNRTQSPQNDANGGAIYTYGIHTFITNCNFIGNTTYGQAASSSGDYLAYSYGGAAYIQGLNNGNVIIDNCNFEDNICTAICTYQAGSGYGKGYAYGGAIHIRTAYNFQNVVLSNSSFNNNKAMGIGSSSYDYSYGGAIAIRNGSLTADTVVMENLLFDGNIADGNNSSAGFGTLYIDGGLTKIKYSQIINNESRNEAVRFEDGYTEIEYSLFSNNQSSALGIIGSKSHIIKNCLFENNTNSAIRLAGLTPSNPLISSTIQNSTFTQNSSLDGSAIYLSDCNNRVNILNCTLMDNTVTVAGKAIAISVSNSSNVFLQNNIISMPVFSSNPLITQTSSSITSGGGNIVRDGSAALYLNQPNDMNSTNPNLGTYGNHGGPTKTYALLANSPAINIDPVASLSIDQRGFIRDNQTDAGAFEFGASNPNMPVIISSSNDTTICAEENISISVVTNSIPNNPIQYKWKLNGNVMAGETNASVNFTPLTSGVYTFSCTAFNSSDSAISNNIIVNVLGLPNISASPDNSICQGSSTTISATGGVSYTWNNGLGTGSSHSVSPANTTTYTVTGSDVNGCKNTDQVVVTVLPVPVSNINQTACGSYTWTSGNGQTYTSSTTATHTLVGGAANGCDSIVTLNLTINQPASRTINQTACGTYTWTSGNGQTYTSSTTATHTLVGGAANGCDSTITLNLTIKQPASHTINQTACGTYTWTSGNGQTYTSSTTATHTLAGGAANGCDSTITLNLTIKQPAYHTINQTACGTYTWTSGNGQIYTSSTTATYTLVGGAANGCDSTITLNLTINQPTSHTINQTACGSYTWTSGNGQTYTSSTTATHTLVGGAANGCDSTITLNLTINQPASHTINQTACGTYTWTSGNGQTYTSSTTATHTLLGGAVNGCDSTITLNLTIHHIDSSVTQNGLVLTATESGASYQWVDCANGFIDIAGETGQSFQATANGQYAVEVSANGCTSMSDCIEIFTVGIENNNAAKWEIYPNPAIHHIFISGLEANNTYHIKIIDLQGKVCLENRIFESGFLDISILKMGFYIINIQDNTGKIEVRTIVKME